MVNESEVPPAQEFFSFSFRNNNAHRVRSNSDISMLWFDESVENNTNSNSKMPQPSGHLDSLFGILRNKRENESSSSPSSTETLPVEAPAAGVASAVRSTATIVAFPEVSNSPQRNHHSSSTLHDSADLSLAEMLELSQELEDDPLEGTANRMEPSPVAENATNAQQKLHESASSSSPDWLAMMGMKGAPQDIPLAADLVFAVDDDEEQTSPDDVGSRKLPAVPSASAIASSSSSSFAQQERTAVASLSSHVPSQRRSSNTSSSGSRPFQTCQWNEKFKELCLYKQQYGHAQVPLNPEKPQFLALARWVKRQRYQYKLFQEGQPSSMTMERLQDLESVGFVWDSQGANWSERLQELKDYRAEYGDCNVPTNYRPNRPLATWVKCQRRQKKLFDRGESSNITRERIQELDNLGFEWTLRSEYGKRK